MTAVAASPAAYIAREKDVVVVREMDDRSFKGVRVGRIIYFLPVVIQSGEMSMPAEATRVLRPVVG